MEDNEPVKSPCMDFSFPLNLAKDKTEKKIYSFLCELSQKFYKNNERKGLLIVLGVFGYGNNSAADGMRELSTKDKIDKYINVNFAQFKEDVLKIFEAGNDGAIVINRDGQVLAQKVYLVIDNAYDATILEGCGTRHISASAFSKNKNIISVFTLSEETHFVRLWRDGNYTEQYCPAEQDKDDDK
jgi:DNA integrity scanning protein DisA with diadenylate cyclase activity